MKKSSLILGSFIGLVLTVTSVAALTPAIQDFKDLPDNHWATSAIDWAVDNKIVEGYKADNTFRGDNPMSRYEVVQVLFKYEEVVQELVKKHELSMSEQMTTLELENEVMKLQIEDLMKNSNYFPLGNPKEYADGEAFRYICVSTEDGTRVYKDAPPMPDFETNYYDMEGKSIEGEVKTENCQLTTPEYYDSKVKK